MRVRKAHIIPLLSKPWLGRRSRDQVVATAAPSVPDYERKTQLCYLHETPIGFGTPQRAPPLPARVAIESGINSQFGPQYQHSRNSFLVQTWLGHIEHMKSRLPQFAGKVLSVLCAGEDTGQLIYDPSFEEQGGRLFMVGIVPKESSRDN